MKKQLKTTVMAIALLATVTGAFASDIVNAISGKKLVAYTWQKYLSDGVTPDGLPQSGDENNPFLEECPDGSEVVCAIGTPVDPEEGQEIRVYYPQ